LQTIQKLQEEFMELKCSPLRRDDFTRRRLRHME
jgi:hypothetical protein